MLVHPGEDGVDYSDFVEEGAAVGGGAGGGLDDDAACGHVVADFFGLSRSVEWAAGTKSFSEWMRYMGASSAPEARFLATMSFQVPQQDGCMLVSRSVESG